MKIRGQFVSNSSSSSFIIKLRNLSGPQLGEIFNIDDPTFKEFPWSISLNKHTLTGYTCIDNFSMYKFFLEIGVDKEHIEWEG